MLMSVEGPERAPLPRRLAWIASLLVCSVTSPPAFAEGIWITHPAIEAQAPVSLQFRRAIDLARVPARARVRISADNRYVLYINGHRVAAGPARGDLKHWRYRTIDVAPFLKRGRNVIAAQVWNDGPEGALSQISARTGFLLAPTDRELSAVESGPAWQVRIDRSRTVSPAAPLLAKSVGPEKYYAAGLPELHDANLRSDDWLTISSAGRDWLTAQAAVRDGEPVPWTLIEDRLPPMVHVPAPGGMLVRSEGVQRSRFPRGSVTIPPHSVATLTLDAGKVLAAYPRLMVSGGSGAQITITYSEALYGPDGHYLSDRAQVRGGESRGLSDRFLPDGSSRSTFQPFWWRVWRFAEIRVKTGNTPLRLDQFSRFDTGYPFTQRARFMSSDPELNRIWQTGWDTVRLDAHETFMDTAYWEQLQYIGDTRIEALISYLVSGDPRLGVQALEAFDSSNTDGIPRSRWPAREDQSIPPFALLWIGMLHDFMRYQPDPMPLRRSQAGVRSVLAWYRRHLDSNGLVGTTPGWEFIDWRPTLSNTPWASEKPKSDPCVITLLYIGALKQAVDLESVAGEASRAQTYGSEAARQSQAVRDHCWSPSRGLYADTPAKVSFSQHANALAILYDVAPEAERAHIMDRITVRNGGIAAPEGVTGTTFYFAYYLAGALDHAGLGDRYLELLSPWRNMLARNFTTWPEEPDPTRSDSHAWSAHPTADLLRIVAGIQPAGRGFGRVRVAPHLGTLTRLDAALPHPSGQIEVRYRLGGDRLRATIVLPKKISGHFLWRGRQMPLHAGKNRFEIEAGDE